MTNHFPKKVYFIRDCQIVEAAVETIDVSFPPRIMRVGLYPSEVYLSRESATTALKNFLTERLETECGK